MKRLFMCVLLAVLASGACGGGQDDGRLTIAVIPKGTTHAFWQSIRAGAERAGRELDVNIIWRGPLREDDRASQITEVEGFITRGVSGIVLAPLDETALALPVADAQRRNIPVVIFDSGLRGADYVSFVATDNWKGGRLAGEHVASRLNGTGRVVLLRYAEGHDSTTQREEGFLEALAEHPGIEILSSNQYAGADVEGAYKRGEPPVALPRARRQPRRRRDLLRERIIVVRHDARAAGSQLGGEGTVRRLRRLRWPGEGARGRAHRRARRAGPGEDGLPRRQDDGVAPARRAGRSPDRHRRASRHAENMDRPDHPCAAQPDLSRGEP
jgi:hypothetical protein